ncbi:protein takeout-like [Homalodisca vitripennis]|uniref:protein takeout-like n=1 Tax=Homalodisca vitripennis TaxID=197043 RepID=UPI001EEC5BC1|nr:protein takeout-like [Homalodisca vitripennis]
MAAALRTPLLLLLVAALARAAPRFKACKRSLPAAKLNECVRDSLQKAVPELVKGIPQFGLNSIDPLRVDSLEVPKGSNTAVSVEISFKNLDILGLKNAKIKSVDMDVEGYKMKSKIEIDGPIMLQGDYTINGKVLVLPIQGTGRCNITLVNPKGEITELIAKPLTKDGKDFAQVTSLKFVVNEADRVYYDLQNLFNGNKELGENMNLVLNDNWKQILDDMRGPVQTALGAAFRQIADNVVHKVPYTTIFP